MSDEVFAARSRAAFFEHFPAIAARLKDGNEVESAIEVENGAAIDIRVGGRRIYGGNARAFARGQVEAYIRKPLRFFVQRLDTSGIVTKVGQRLIGRIEDALRENAFGEFSSRPTDNPTFLIVFGLGLGHHLQDLVRQTEARWLIIVEPLLAFIEPSCEVVDWAKLIDAFEDRGGSVHFVTDTDPDRIVSGIGNVVLSKGVPYTDGSWVFTHYPFWAFDAARDRLHEAMEFAFINRGFFEDELVMMRNTVENFGTREFRLLENRMHLRRPEIAAIVGAGPSLDESIETLHRIRDRVVLFSAGTALRALLRNGLVPDFHCELENVPGVFDVLTETSQVADLSGITLIASSTVDPRVPGLFHNTIFYFRDSVSSTEILRGKHRQIFGTSPTCVNLAVVTGAVMGFTDFVLFGADCGVRKGRSRHAKGTVYSEVGVFEAGNKAQSPALEVEGNFGGTVSAEIVYNVCRLMLVDAFKHFGLNVVNCSDGALIPGAQPCVPEALEIPGPPLDRAAYFAEIDRITEPYRPGALLEEADIDAIRRRTEEMFADLDAMLVELGEGEADFAAAYNRIMAFVRGAKGRYHRTESMISGSLQALPRIAMFYGFRVATEAGRRVLFELFIDEFRAIAVYMAETIDALFDELASGTQVPAERVAAMGGR